MSHLLFAAGGKRGKQNFSENFFDGRSGAALFAAGYFWALRGIDHETLATAKSSDAAGMKGTENMAGTEGMSGTQNTSGMTPGTVMVSPEKQQLLGVRTAVVQKRPW